MSKGGYIGLTRCNEDTCVCETGCSCKPLNDGVANERRRIRREALEEVRSDLLKMDHRTMREINNYLLEKIAYA